MAMSGGTDDGEPMMEMNTTPLIDVMLVLLIMFIITIPVATHAINVDLPIPNPNPPDDILEPDKNKLVITQEDVLLWNGTAIDEPTLLSLLNQSKAIAPEPELQFQPEPAASYEKSANALKIIKGSGVTNFGFVGNEQYRDFAIQQ